MNYITTTDLRTKSKQLIKALEEGQSVSLVHRSKIIGEIKPKIYDPKPFDTKKFANTVEKLKLPKLSSKQIEVRYRKAMEVKYGKNIS